MSKISKNLNDPNYTIGPSGKKVFAKGNTISNGNLMVHFFKDVAKKHFSKWSIKDENTVSNGDLTE